MTTLFSSPEPVELPAAEPVTPMPDAETTAKDAKKKQARRLATSGRASTFLSSYSEPTEKLGG